MKQYLSWLEIVFSIVCMIFSTSAYISISRIAEQRSIDSAAKTVLNWKRTVGDCRKVFEDGYKTLPQHQKTLQAFSDRIDNLKTGCDKTKDSIEKWTPKWDFVQNAKWIQELKELPGAIYQPFGEAKESLQQTIKILDDIQKGSAYKNAQEGVQKVMDGCDDVHSDLLTMREITKTASFLFLLAFWAMSICFFSHGIISLSESRRINGGENAH